MASEVLYSIGPNEYSDTQAYKQLGLIFADSEVRLSPDAVIPRGGFEYWPQVGIALAFVGTAYASGLIGKIASDHYDDIKARVKKALKEVRPTRHIEWPAHIPTPQFCSLTIQLKTARHSFMMDFNISSLDSLDRALEELPNFIDSLNSNTIPTHHLLLWDKKKWIVTLTHPLN